MMFIILNKLIKSKIIYIIFLSIVITGCKSNKKNLNIYQYNKEPKYKDYTLKVNKILIIGGNDIKNESNLIGRVADFCFDEKGSIYICDDINIEIKKFTKEGNYVKNFGNGEGEGPNEFLLPRRIQFHNNNLFVLDYNLNRITQFNQNGVSVKAIQVKTLNPANFILSNEFLYLIGFGIYPTYPIQILNYKGDLVGSFGSRSKDSLLVSKTGNSGAIICSNNYIFYANYYPYIIYKFSFDGELISSFTRNSPFIAPPNNIRSQRTGRYFVSPQGGVRFMTTLNNNHLFILLEDWKKLGNDEKITQVLDLYDKFGDWLLTIPIDEYFKINWTRVIKFDQNGNIYLTSDEPYPHIEKFSFELKAKNGIDILGN